MGDLARTYGKTWVLWQVDRGDTLPLGPPQLIGVANGKELDWDTRLFEQRDKAMGISTKSIREYRDKLEMPPVHAAADASVKGNPPPFIGAA